MTMPLTWAIPVAHQTAVDRFISGWPAPLGPSGPMDRAPLNAHVLAFAHSLRDPVGALFEPDPYLDKIAWAALGYYKPGDKFRVDDAWLRQPYDNAVSLETMLRAWSARQPRTWSIAQPYPAIMQLDASAVKREALFWWNRLQVERAFGREPMPPGFDSTKASMDTISQKEPWWWVPVFAVSGIAVVGLGYWAWNRGTDPQIFRRRR